jgi:hypothetical protein
MAIASGSTALPPRAQTHPGAADVGAMAVQGGAFGAFGGVVGNLLTQMGGGTGRVATLGKWAGRIGLGAVGAMSARGDGASILRRHGVGSGEQLSTGAAVADGAVSGAAFGAVTLGGALGLAKGAGSALMGHKPLVVAANAAKMGGQWAVAGAVAGAVGGGLSGVVLDDPSEVPETTAAEAWRVAEGTLTRPTSWILPTALGGVAAVTGVVGAKARSGQAGLTAGAVKVGAVRGLGAALGTAAVAAGMFGGLAGAQAGAATLLGSPRRIG